VRSRAHHHRRPRIAVCLVEHHRLARCYLHDILERDSSFQVFSEEAVLGRSAAEDIVAPIFVIDVGTLGASLVSLLTILRSRFREAKTLLLDEELSSYELRRLPFLGVQGFLPYDKVSGHLGLALQTISDGDMWFPPEALKEFSHHSRASRLEGLSDIFTPREKLVVGLVERRLGNKEIAAILRISESTVKFHLANIYTKLGVRNRHSVADVATSVSQQIEFVARLPRV
jgi:DNA-binding NarL/FixJ family response regulator